MAIISFDSLTRGMRYSRPTLASLWNYRGYEALARGIVTPTGTRYVILFITQNKAEYQPQYRDRLVGDSLFMQGEDAHRSDYRMVNSKSNGDEIHLFYRDQHHEDFEYKGKVELVNHILKMAEPSEFEFSIAG
jgi:putative restriction endonuclease